MVSTLGVVVTPATAMVPLLDLLTEENPFVDQCQP